MTVSPTVRPDDAEVQRLTFETAADMAPLAMLMMATETEPLTLIGLYAALSRGALAISPETVRAAWEADGPLAALFGPAALGLAGVGCLVSAAGWMAHELGHWCVCPPRNQHIRRSVCFFHERA